MWISIAAWIHSDSIFFFKSHSSVALVASVLWCYCKWFESFKYWIWMHCDGWQSLWWSECRTHEAHHRSGIWSRLIFVMISIRRLFSVEREREKEQVNLNRKENHFRWTLNAKCHLSRAVWVRVCAFRNSSCDKWKRFIIIYELWLRVFWKMTKAMNNSAMTFPIMRP